MPSLVVFIEKNDARSACPPARAIHRVTGISQTVDARRLHTEKAVEGAAGGDVKVETSSGSVAVTDKKTGTVTQSGTSVALPAGWPASIPMYPGAVVRNALVTTGAKSATLATKDSAAKVHEFYAKTKTMKLESDMDLGAQRMMAFTNGNGTTSVTIGAAGADTMISIAVVD